MNIIILLSIALVLCAYFWTACPKILKENKQLLSGVVVGLFLCLFYNSRVEGLDKEAQQEAESDGCGEKNSVDNGDGTFKEVWSNCDPDINICINNNCISNSEFTRLCNNAAKRGAVVPDPPHEGKDGANSSHNSSHAIFTDAKITPEEAGLADGSEHGHFHAYYDKCTNSKDCKGESAFNNNTGRWCVNGHCLTTSDFFRYKCPASPLPYN